MLDLIGLQRGDIQRHLTLIIMGALILMMFPMSIYRFLMGEILHCVVDLFMLTIASFLFYRAYHYKLTNTLHFVSVLSFMVMTSALIFIKGVDSMLWLFPGIIGTYFLLSCVTAFWVNISFVFINMVILINTITKTEALNIYPSLLMVCVFGYVLSKRAEFQNEQLFKLASVDPLTGVGNRRSFDDHVQAILASNNRTPQKVSMMVLDLDLFKKVNDQYGHKKGDQVLIEFASRIKSIIRETDHIYRFGGEEFVVIANESTVESAGNLAEMIRIYIKDAPQFVACDVTVSIGVSELVSSDNSDSWFKRADSALYEAKKTGRNRVILAHYLNETAFNFTPFDNSKKSPQIRSKKHSLIRSTETCDSNYNLTSKHDMHPSDDAVKDL